MTIEEALQVGKIDRITSTDGERWMVWNRFKPSIGWAVYHRKPRSKTTTELCVGEKDVEIALYHLINGR